MGKGLRDVCGLGGLGEKYRLSHGCQGSRGFDIDEWQLKAGLRSEVTGSPSLSDDLEVRAALDAHRPAATAPSLHRLDEGRSHTTSCPSAFLSMFI